MPNKILLSSSVMLNICSETVMLVAMSALRYENLSADWPQERVYFWRHEPDSETEPVARRRLELSPP